jgi:hypothetical protein
MRKCALTTTEAINGPPHRDLRAFLPGSEPGDVAASPLNPTPFER